MNPDCKHGYRWSHCNDPLAPWERELLGMADPYVNVAVQFKDGTVEQFYRVRGFKFKKGMLTFENAQEVLYYLPNVKFWSNTYCEQ